MDSRGQGESDLFERKTLKNKTRKESVGMDGRGSDVYKACQALTPILSTAL